MIETTGLANPKPLIETFAASDAVAAVARLDGVVTLVDAANAHRHLEGEGRGGRRGCGRAGRPRALRRRALPPPLPSPGDTPTPDNGYDPVPSDAVQQVAYADRIVLNKADLVTPAELETLRARLAAINASAPLTVATMASVDVAAVLETRGFDLEAVAETLAAAPCGTPAHGEPGHVCGGGHDHGHAHHDHGHEGGHEREGGHNHSHSHPAPSSHTDGVSTVALTLPGEFDLELVNMWLGALVDVRSDDLYRFKGVLAVRGFPARYVFQGVHALFSGEAGSDWGPGEPRASRMVFIGRGLDADLLREGFEECVVEADGVPRGRKKAGVVVEGVMDV